jgi:protein-tyrosine phosphatase
MVDIHCHPLPGLDDGASGWDEALAMARMAAADGIAVIVATPHQLGTFGRNHGVAILSQADRLQQQLNQEGVAIRILPGAEVRIEPGLIPRLRSGELLTLGNLSKHVLLELPHEIYFPIERVLEELRSAGMVGILAHPERNQGIFARPETAAVLVRAGCLVQVTAGSLLGSFGPEVQQFATRLVQRGLVHFIATDAHSSKARRPLLGKAFDYVKQLVGVEVATSLCCRNPACVAAGKPVVVAPAAPRHASHGSWFPWRKAG